MSHFGRPLNEQEAASLVSSLRSKASVSDVRFPVGLSWRFRAIDGVEFKHVDLGGPKIFGSWFRRKTFRRCIFDGAVLDGIAMWRVDFDACIFNRTTLGNRKMGMFKKCRFTDCLFQECRIEDVSFDETSLLKCQFEGGRITDGAWRNCTLDEVQARSEMKSLGFTGCTFRRVDFSRSSFKGCTFAHNVSGEPLLPNNRDNFLLNPRELLNVEADLKAHLSSRGLTKYVELAKMVSQATWTLLVDESMFSDIPSEDRSAIMKVLYEKRQVRDH